MRTAYIAHVSISPWEKMLNCDRVLYNEGLWAISLQAAAAVLPELIPGPIVPIPVHSPAAKKAIPERRLSVSGFGVINNKIMEITREKITGVSIIASLIKVNENNLL